MVSDNIKDDLLKTVSEDIEDVESTSITNEAEEILTKYISAVAHSYKEIGLSNTEINETINEVKEHIVKLSSFYAGEGEIVSTDLIKKAIKKLGDPEVIKNTLIEEKGFFEENQLKLFSDELLNQKSPGAQYGIRAINLVRIYEFISWVMTASIIFLMFNYDAALYIGQLAYFFGFLILYFVKSSSIYKSNSLLRERIRMNFHIAIFPIVYLIVKFAINQSSSYFGDPMMITLWLIIHTNKDNRNYYIEQRKVLKSYLNER